MNPVEAQQPEGPDRSATAYWAPWAWVDGRPRPSVRIVVRDGRFAEVLAQADRVQTDIALDGMVLPGAANCHAHTFHRALRGLGREGSTFWGWRETMYRIAANLTPEVYYRYARAVYAEMLLAGYTTVAEFHYVHHRPGGTPYDDPNAMGKALIRAARDAGIRITLLDACYLHAGVGGDPPSDEQRRFSDVDARSWVSRVGELAEWVESNDVIAAGARIGAAAHSVRACSPDEAAAVAEWARAGKRPLHAHLSEQPAENAACVRATGMTPAALLDSVGFWDEHAVAVHATHLSDGDIDILARAHAKAAICPSTEADLADGIPQAARMRDAGIGLCIGSDENVSIDPFEEARLLAGNERLISGRRDAFAPGELVSVIAAEGQRAAGWPESGRIESGALADFLVLDPRSTRTAGADVHSFPLLACAADVADVFVSGRQVVSAGRHHGIDPVDDIGELTTQLKDGARRWA